MKSFISAMLFGLLAFSFANTNPLSAYARPQTIRPGSPGLPGSTAPKPRHSQSGFQNVNAKQPGQTIQPRNGQYFTPDELELIARTELSNFTGAPAAGSAVIDRVGVGEVLVVFGHSVAQGETNQVYTNPDPRVRCVNYHDPECKEANLPLVYSPVTATSKIGPFGSGPYVWGRSWVINSQRL
ncbi:hypothetical protein [Spirosoma endbachense]|uniref:Uncharacterized protein n=1 Tax=Spirosoma endbachense TaxID=2666025 RepID=A0A6P1VMS8_9BACT|nr:hypothetical protein [Spirosoma endbachense]QHV94005.1 hypothetical protein GJR95_02730 [Spirosoma endbachense]